MEELIDELEDLIFRLQNEIDSERYFGGDVPYIHKLELELEGAQDAYNKLKEADVYHDPQAAH